MASKPVWAVQGSMLHYPFGDSVFDLLVSVGCFHHTGDLQRCVDEAYRIHGHGGRVYAMVYNKFSYRNWLRWPWETLKSCVLMERGGKGQLSKAQRVAYDACSRGLPAPGTVFTSISELEAIFNRYPVFEAHKEN